jgi:hypothetical protein
MHLEDRYMGILRKFTALAISLTFLFSALAVAQEKKSGGAPKGPRLSIESLSHDFGEVKAGTPLKFTFKVRNEGDDNLLIQSVAPS